MCASLVVFDDFQEEGSYEFANMKATSNAEDEFAHGRTPKGDVTGPPPRLETASWNRKVLPYAGHHGRQARLALDMGVPIYGIVGFTATATDKIGRSVPAPGQGVLTTAREQPGEVPVAHCLDIKYRRATARFAPSSKSRTGKSQS